MTDSDPQQTPSRASGQAGDAERFARGADESSTGIVREFWAFLRYNKKWWLTPIIAVLLLLGVLVILSSTAAAPFIYTLF